MIRILASDGMEKGAIKALEAKGCEVVCEFFDPEALKEAVKEYDVLVVRSATKVRVPHIDAACEAGKLKLVIGQVEVADTTRLTFETIDGALSGR